ncbi:MAG: ABC transporter transmembrane domain-containing protein [Verrucomicrobia bacterium]|nr:ABC transporter transmembrane domain-containing protein [Verrucomicrobiota bacterium]
MKPARGLVAGATIALLIGTALQLVFPFFVGMLIDSTLASRAATATLGAEIPEWASNINHVALVLLAVAMAILVCVYMDTAWFMRAGELALRELRQRTFERIVRLPMQFHASVRAADLASRVQSDLAVLQEFLINDARMGLRYGALMTGGFVLMTVTSPLLAVTLGVLIPPVVAIGIKSGRAIARFSKQAQERLGDSAVIVDESLQAITSVKAFANESVETQRYATAQERYFEVVVANSRRRAIFLAFILCAVFCSTVFMMWFGSRQIQLGNLTPGEFTRFMFYLAFTGSAMGTVAESFSRMKRAQGAFERTQEILNVEPETSAATLSTDTPPLTGNVRFEQVSFAYPAREDAPVLRNIDLTVAAGETIALVGPSGAGKSTLISLLLRFFEPDAGTLFFDNIRSSEIPLARLRAQMALVPQEIILFGCSLMDNIRYGNPAASDEATMEAARQAHLHDFITSLPEGYQTRAGDRGTQLSGGQRQRIAIARAILRAPRILILDEATSALDSESEAMVHESMRALFAERTSFIIAHRLSTVRLASRIVVVRDGRIADQGTHDELIERDGFYRDLWNQR